MICIPFIESNTKIIRIHIVKDILESPKNHQKDLKNIKILGIIIK
jgi:hypothetical protein